MIDPDRFGPWVSREARIALRATLEGRPAPVGDVSALRSHYDLFNRGHLQTALEHYPVNIARDELDGVAVDVVTPKDGTANNRTLISLHGGAFMWGRGAGALLEAVPVASILRTRVIAVEYALSPEEIYPAAVDDVCKVHRVLCGTIPPNHVGIYGCSAGGVLTAQVVARLIKEQGPLPGAIAMLCGAGLDMQGDSAMTAGPLSGAGAAGDPPNLAVFPYFACADINDAGVFPGSHKEILARFPPSLLATGLRDFAASSVVTMHRRLLDADAVAELLCFDGMAHAFHMATTLPESRELFTAMARFFDRHLG